MRMLRSSRLERLAAAALLASATLLHAEGMPVPVQTQAALFAKVLQYDRKLSVRAGGDIVVGILHQSKLRESAAVARDAAAAFATQKTIAALPVSVVTLDLDDPAIAGNLRGSLESRKVDVLYVCPLRAFDVASIAKSTSALGVLSLTGVPKYADALSVGLDMTAGKPQIVVNLAASRAEGADFASDLLRLARVIK